MEVVLNIGKSQVSFSNACTNSLVLKKSIESSKYVSPSQNFRIRKDVRENLVEIIIIIFNGGGLV